MPVIQSKGKMPNLFRIGLNKGSCHRINLPSDKTKKGKLHKNKERQNAPPFFKMKIIKKGQTYPVYSAYTNRAFERIQLLVQSWETKSHRMCHFLIILHIVYWYSKHYNTPFRKCQKCTNDY